MVADPIRCILTTREGLGPCVRPVQSCSGSVIGRGGVLVASTALTPDEWLPALADPRHLLTFPWYGFDTVSWDWSYHQRILDDHLLYLVTTGTCTGDIGGAPIELRAGSLLWMQPRQRHTFLLGDQPLTLYFTRFRLRRGGEDLTLTGPDLYQWDGAWGLVDLLDELQDELRTHLPWRDMRIRGLLVTIAAAVFRGGDGEQEPASKGRLTRAQRRAIDDYVREHLADRPTPSDLARHINLSPDYFARLFVRTFGLPPRTWLVHDRLHRGARLLSETVRTISEISQSLGYDDVSAFSHQFKQRYGVSPRTFRQAQR